jgi:hypothetical protein
MISSRAVGAGAFVLIGLLLFAVGLFMIGERRMLFGFPSTSSNDWRAGRRGR